MPRQGSESQYAPSSAASIGDGELPSLRRPSFLARALARFGGGGDRPASETGEPPEAPHSNGDEAEEPMDALTRRPSFIERTSRRMR